MKTTINNKRYDTAKCETLGEHDHYNNGNYSGTTYLERASDGQLLVHTKSNGQDCYLKDDLRAFDSHFDDSVDDYDLTDEQEARCAELGLIDIIS